jgi:hypothetical protein
MKWQMSELCEAIIKNVELSFDDDDYAVQQLYLAKRLNHDDWIKRAVIQILRRVRTLNSDEIDLLDSKVVSQLFSLREAYRMEIVRSNTGNYQSGSPYSADVQTGWFARALPRNDLIDSLVNSLRSRS